jgi:hypothetical protein
LNVAAERAPRIRATNLMIAYFEVERLTSTRTVTVTTS